MLYSDGIDESERATYPACLRAARESGIPIYLIVANPREEREEDGGFLTEPAAAKFQRLAEAGGGQVYFIHPNQDLAGVYGHILAELRSQYTLGFYAKDTAPPPRRLEQDRGRGEGKEGADRTDGERGAGAAVGGGGPGHCSIIHLL